jgi:hypothetical protein
MPWPSGNAFQRDRWRVRERISACSRRLKMAVPEMLRILMFQSIQIPDANHSEMHRSG